MSKNKEILSILSESSGTISPFDLKTKMDILADNLVMIGDYHVYKDAFLSSFARILKNTPLPLSLSEDQQAMGLISNLESSLNDRDGITLVEYISLCDTSMAIEIDSTYGKTSMSFTVENPMFREVKVSDICDLTICGVDIHDEMATCDELHDHFQLMMHSLVEDNGSDEFSNRINTDLSPELIRDVFKAIASD